MQYCFRVMGSNISQNLAIAVKVSKKYDMPLVDGYLLLNAAERAKVRAGEPQDPVKRAEWIANMASLLETPGGVVLICPFLNFAEWSQMATVYRAFSIYTDVTADEHKRYTSRYAPSLLYDDYFIMNHANPDAEIAAMDGAVQHARATTQRLRDEFISDLDVDGLFTEFNGGFAEKLGYPELFPREAYARNRLSGG